MLTGIGIGVPFTRRRGFSAGDLFANSEVGVWYDPSDLPTMFQDSAGTTAAAIEQPVGLLLDKSKLLVLGAELITNAADREFTSDSGYWTKTQATISVGVATVTSPDGSVASLSRSITTAGKGYHLEFDLVIRTGGCRVADSTGTAYATFTTSGRKTMKFVASGTGALVFVRSSGITDFDIDNVTIKVLAGNHATQATSTARPVLRAGLDFDGVDDFVTQSAGGGSTTAFFLCAGIKPEGGAGTLRTIWSDTGTNTGYSVRINASNQIELIAGNGTAYTTAATTATLDIGTANVITAWDDGTNLNVQINNGTVASVARPVVSAGSSTATIGKSNTAASNFFNGLIYSLVQVKNDAGTDAERTSTKAYVASKAGVTL